MLAGLVIALAMTASCKSNATAADDNNTQTMTDTVQTDTTSVKVAVETTAGNFTILLYGDTPRHRDNFVKLVKEGYYDSTLFHRVIKDFMIQAGDPDSRKAAPGQALGSGGPDYKIDAEIVFPKHYHKRGALAAARQGDQVNPMKQSSGSQFYVVTGRVLSEGEVAQLENHLNNSKKQSIFNSLAMAHRDSIIAMQQRGDRAGLQALQEKLIAETEAKVAQEPAPGISEEMKQDYTTIGGAPHLDGQYTVFGEVIDGMDTIDKIEKVETDGRDRPNEDVRILSMKILPNE